MGRTDIQKVQPLAESESREAIETILIKLPADGRPLWGDPWVQQKQEMVSAPGPGSRLCCSSGVMWRPPPWRFPGAVQLCVSWTPRRRFPACSWSVCRARSRKFEVLSWSLWSCFILVPALSGCVSADIAALGVSAAHTPGCLSLDSERCFPVLALPLDLL